MGNCQARRPRPSGSRRSIAGRVVQCTGFFPARDKRGYGASQFAEPEQDLAESLAFGQQIPVAGAVNGEDIEALHPLMTVNYIKVVVHIPFAEPGEGQMVKEGWSGEGPGYFEDGHARDQRFVLGRAEDVDLVRGCQSSAAVKGILFGAVGGDKVSGQHGNF